MFYYDYTYLLFMIPGLIITVWASAKMNSTYKKYQNVRILSGLTGAEAARRILDMNGLQHVAVNRVSGSLTDHYDPRTQTVSLSDSTYNSPSVGAVGVAAHECGHAVQDATGYTFLKVRNAIVPVCNIGSKLSVPLIIIGFILSMTQLVTVGIILFSLAVVFQLITLPVEFNASSRALQTLNDTGMVTPEESGGVQKVLTAAALTYVAALLQSLLQLLYYVSLSGRRRK